MVEAYNPLTEETAVLSWQAELGLTKQKGRGLKLEDWQFPPIKVPVLLLYTVSFVQTQVLVKSLTDVSDGDLSLVSDMLLVSTWSTSLGFPLFLPSLGSLSHEGTLVSGPP